MEPDDRGGIGCTAFLAHAGAPSGGVRGSGLTPPATTPHSRLDRILQRGKFVLDPASYVMVGLPVKRLDLVGKLADQPPAFFAVLLDSRELTLFLNAEAWRDRFASVVVDREPLAVRLITLDVLLPPDLVGLMAVLSGALAREGISILPLAANQRDHLFVPAEDAERALEVLESLGSRRLGGADGCC